MHAHVRRSCFRVRLCYQNIPDVLVAEDVVRHDGELPVALDGARLLALHPPPRIHRPLAAPAHAAGYVFFSIAQRSAQHNALYIVITCHIQATAVLLVPDEKFSIVCTEHCTQQVTLFARF